MRIKYIGSKPVKTDNVAMTGAVWIGYGDVQEIPDKVAGKLLQFDDVWANADADVPLAAAPVKPKEPDAPVVRYALSGPNGTVVLDTMDDQGLRAFATNAALDVDGRIRGDKLRQAIVDAVKAAQV